MGDPSLPIRRPGERIFSLMVQHDNDVVGLVAYSLYKQEKIDFIASRSEDCTDADIDAFCHSVKRPNRLENYRERATQILARMQEELFAEQAAEMERRYQEELNDAIAKLPAHRPVKEWFRHLFQHVVGSMLATVLLVVLLLTALGWKQGAVKTLEQILDIKVVPGSKDDPASGPSGTRATP